MRVEFVHLGGGGGGGGGGEFCVCTYSLYVWYISVCSSC